jgi:two-component system C4-dicarboxylate transport sensor histidine kinase DctB
MNNPLCIISGRSQILASALTDNHQRGMAQQIVDQTHRLSDMITALRRFAEPLKPNPKSTDLQQLLDACIKDVQRRYPRVPEVKVVAPQELPPAHIDAEHLSVAIIELLRNAIESDRCSQIECRIEIEGVDDRLKIRIADNGSGMTAHVLAHAFDPFFSAKPAGRQPGLGLAHARRSVEAHGGQITLENARSAGGETSGAVATIRLDHWRVPEARNDVRPLRDAA